MYFEPRKVSLRLVSILGLAILLVATFPWLDGQAKENNPKLVVYTYDSFVSYGMGPVLKKEFEQKYSADLQFVSTGGSREMLSRLKRELRAGKATADVFVGVERNDTPLATETDVFLPLDRKDIPVLSAVPKDLVFGSSLRLVPYEFGYITLVYNQDKLTVSEVPTTFEDRIFTKFAQSFEHG